MLAAALGTLSHTAMLAWPVALVLAWLLTARREVRASGWALAALLAVGVAWVAQLNDCYEMLAQRNDHGLLAQALHGFEVRNLFVDPSWVSPVLAPLLLLWVVLNLQRGRWPLMLASVLPLALGAVPFFAVTACSSDAVRYQGALPASLPVSPSPACGGFRFRVDRRCRRWCCGSACRLAGRIAATGCSSRSILPWSSTGSSSMRSGG